MTDPYDPSLTLRQHVEAAHAHVRMAQDIAYGQIGSGKKTKLIVKLALNKVQNTLIKLIIHHLPSDD